MVRIGFERLDLHKISATHMKENPASGRVMKKVGMKKEGVLRDHALRWGEYKDLIKYGIFDNEI